MLQTAYVLSYSVIMLNTDQHNPTIKKRMSADDFVRNNRGIDDGRDIPREFLEDLYNRIRSRQIMMRHTMIEAAEEEGASATGLAFDPENFVKNIFAMFGRTQELRAEPTEDQISQLSTFLKARCLTLSHPCPPSGGAVLHTGQIPCRSGVRQSLAQARCRRLCDVPNPC